MRLSSAMQGAVRALSYWAGPLGFVGEQYLGRLGVQRRTLAALHRRGLAQRSMLLRDGKPERALWRLEPAMAAPIAEAFR